MPVSDYSTTPSDNTSISGLTVSDATVADTLDNIIRQMMADIRSADNANVKTATIGSAVQAYDVNLDALSALTGAADQLPYFNGASSMALTTVTSFSRTLLDDTTAATARDTLVAPARPTGTAGVGEFVTIQTAVNTATVLPSGGQWAYFVVVRNNPGLTVATTLAGVAAGGTTIGSAFSTLDRLGFAWRVS